MIICKGCGGVLGRDCWNAAECEAISRDMEMQAYADPYRQEIEELRDALALILPLAKGYAYVNQVGSNTAYIKQAEKLLNSNSDSTDQQSTQTATQEGRG